MIWANFSSHVTEIKNKIFNETIIVIFTVIVIFSIYAMDFNEDATELCIAFGDPCIFISSLEERHISRLYKEKLQTEFMEFDPILYPKGECESDAEEEIRY